MSGLVSQMMKHIPLGPLLDHLTQEPFGSRLAALSVQTKVEKFVLAEIAYGGRNMGDYEFWLEERPRRDLTIRKIGQAGSARPLLEWVEGKMCYSDCVARHLTGRPRPDEYRMLVAQDVAKQAACQLAGDDAYAVMTSTLFVFHRSEPHPRHVYYPGFKHRRGLAPEQIRAEAVRYCTQEIPNVVGRALVEHFDIRLDSRTTLMGFCYSTGTVGLPSA